MRTVGWDAVMANATAGVLGVAAFAVSFTHVRDTATTAGQDGWVATAIAISVELMALAAVTEIRRRGRRGQRAVWPWCVLTLGVTMSLAANLATAQPTGWGYVMAGWPAVAFLSVAVMIETRPTDTNNTTDAADGAALPARGGSGLNDTRTWPGVATARTDDGSVTRTDDGFRTVGRSVRSDDENRTGVVRTGGRAIGVDDDRRAGSGGAVRAGAGFDDEAAYMVSASGVDSGPDVPRNAQSGRGSTEATSDAEQPGGPDGPGGPGGGAPEGASLPQRASRAQTVAWLADTLRADPGWTPDYPALMARTGYGRSWCEKCVADARHAVWGDLAPTLTARSSTTPLH